MGDDDAQRQLELLLFWQKKREQEEEDIRMAMELQKQLEDHEEPHGTILLNETEQQPVVSFFLGRY